MATSRPYCRAGGQKSVTIAASVMMVTLLVAALTGVTVLAIPPPRAMVVARSAAAPSRAPKPYPLPFAAAGAPCDTDGAGSPGCDNDSGYYCRLGWGSEAPTCRRFVSPCDACGSSDIACWDGYTCRVEAGSGYSPVCVSLSPASDEGRCGGTGGAAGGWSKGATSTSPPPTALPAWAQPKPPPAATGEASPDPYGENDRRYAQYLQDYSDPEAYREAYQSVYALYLASLERK
ncbi:hypothetical protein MMPV_000489 [Pyropia vietnamensis]